MKKIILLLFLMLPIIALGQWSVATNMPMAGRYTPFCFTVAGKAYIGTGLDSNSNITVDNNEYNPATNTWITKATPPFSARMGVFSFVIGNYGYVGSGSPNGGFTLYNDFWRYDAASDSWTQMTSFPDIGRIVAQAFVINGKAYIIGGMKPGAPATDNWEYNPITNAWNVMTNTPTGLNSGYVTGFVNGNYIYVGFGGTAPYFVNDFWRFDPASNTWMQLASMPGIPQTRSHAISGINLINGLGFVGLGGLSMGGYLSDFWFYDFAANTWTAAPSIYNFPYSTLTNKTFTIGGTVYIGTGYNPVNNFDDKIYKFIPPGSCCTGGQWTSKSISWGNIIKLPSIQIPNALVKKTITDVNVKNTRSIGLAKKSVTITKCDSVYHLPQNGTYTFNARYQCGQMSGQSCASEIKIKIQGTTDSSLDGIYTAPLNKKFINSGDYNITYSAYCGGLLCGNCSYTLTIDKNCCLNSQWTMGDYQLVNKQPNGDWLYDPVFHSLPFVISSPIPSYSAQVAVNIGHLNYNCQSGCTAGYIVKRKNTRTNIETTEILPPGQTSTTIYSQNDKILVRILPSCGGKSCGKPIMFYVACKGNNCSQSTNSNR